MKRRTDISDSGGCTEKETVTQNLRDAGCDSDTICCFLENMKQNKVCCALKMLEKHRCCLLSELHSCQRKLDCLDFLIYKLRKYINSKGDK